MESELFLQSPLSSNTAYSALHRLVSDTTYTRMRIIMAFASRGGVSLLSEAVNARSSPLSIYAVVGLDGRITEPEALQQLQNTYPDRVRCFESEEANTMLHAKTYCFDDEQECGSFSLLVGSSNLTTAGLLNNREGVIMLLLNSDEPHHIRQEWELWWQQIWNSAQPLDSAIISDYRRDYRQSHPPHVPDRTSGRRRERTRVSIRTASELWLEVGAITGGSANQLEIPQEVVVYFGVDSNRHSVRRQIILTRGGNSWQSNVMAYYSRNGMWRINLDTGIYEVRNRDLRGHFLAFRRVNEPDTYSFTVLDSHAIHTRRAASVALGNYRTTPSREYGWL